MQNDDIDDSILRELEQRNSTLKGKIFTMEKLLADLLHYLDQIEHRHNYYDFGIEGAANDCMGANSHGG
jgi:hypothetical protein